VHLTAPEILMSAKPAIVDKDHPPAYPAGVKWDIEIPPMTLNQMVDEAIAEFGDKNALDFLGKKLTFNQLDELIDKAAKGFQDLGIQKGDRVGVFMPNSTYHFIMFFGALKAGATIVPFLSTYTEDQIQQQIEDSGAKMMVTMTLDSGVSSFYPKIENLLKKGAVPDDFKVVACPMAEILPDFKKLMYPIVKGSQITDIDYDDPVVSDNVLEYGEFMKNGGDYTPVPVTPDDIALLQYTNGTSSGAPKGVILTHGNITANVLQTEAYMVSLQEKTDSSFLQKGEEKILGILPYFHVYGMNVLMMFSMRAGAEVVILPNPRDLHQIVATVKTEKPTIAPFVPKHFQALLERKAHLPILDTLYRFLPTPFQNAIDKVREKATAKDFSHFSEIKYFMSGSEKLKVPLREAFQKATGRPILQGYGLSETSPILTAESGGKQSPAESVGFVLPRVELKIIPETLPNELPKNWEPVEIGVKGEVCARGPNVTQGYWKRPEATSKSFNEAGWFRTGDIGILDAEGRLAITGRSKDIIIVNGENVASAAIEEKIMAFKGVIEVGAVPVEDPRSGEAAVAFIRFKAGQTPPDESSLRAYLKETNTPALEIPKHIVFWPEDKELPAIGVGKQDKNVLRRLAAEQFGLKKDGPAAPHI
jgi:long-chain acyl-CoA synthetase